MKEALETPYNKCIFRETFTDRGFGGKIKMAKAYSGVLSLEQLSALWSSTRGKYI